MKLVDLKNFWRLTKNQEKELKTYDFFRTFIDASFCFRIRSTHYFDFPINRYVRPTQWIYSARKEKDIVVDVFLCKHFTSIEVMGTFSLKPFRLNEVKGREDVVAFTRCY